RASILALIAALSESERIAESSSSIALCTFLRASAERMSRCALSSFQTCLCMCDASRTVLEINHRKFMDSFRLTVLARDAWGSTPQHLDERLLRDVHAAD